MHRIGIISDTHGLLRSEALEFLRDCEHIIHGGDINVPEVLEHLQEIGPVTAVRGNNDKGTWAKDLPETQLLEFGGKLIYVIHDLALIDLDPVAANIDVVVYGHSHKPRIENRDGVLYVNPGSAGPRRFRLPICVAELRIHKRTITPKIVNLELQGASHR